MTDRTELNMGFHLVELYAQVNLHVGMGRITRSFIDYFEYPSNETHYVGIQKCMSVSLQMH